MGMFHFISGDQTYADETDADGKIKPIGHEK